MFPNNELDKLLHDLEMGAMTKGSLPEDICLYLINMVRDLSEIVDKDQECLARIASRLK